MCAKGVMRFELHVLSLLTALDNALLWSLFCKTNGLLGFTSLGKPWSCRCLLCRESITHRSEVIALTEGLCALATHRNAGLQTML